MILQRFNLHCNPTASIVESQVNRHASKWPYINDKVLFAQSSESCSNREIQFHSQTPVMVCLLWLGQERCREYIN